MGVSERPADPDSSVLSILSIDTQSPDQVLVPLIQDYNECHALFANGASLFPFSFQFHACVMSLPPVSELAGRESDRLLLSALRGDGVPLSYPTDWEAVEWAFRSSLNESGAPAELETFLREIQQLPPDRPAVLTLLTDLCDPLSAGMALPLLTWAREKLSAYPNVQLNLLCMPQTLSGDESRFLPVLHQVLDALKLRSLLRLTEDRPSCGADFAWLISLPSSMAKSPEAFRLLYAAAARILGRLASRQQFPAPGLHTLTIPEVVTFASLDAQAPSVTALLQCACWFLTDLLPSMRSEMERAPMLRALTPTAHAAFFRKCLRQMADPAAHDPARLILLERVLKAFLSETVAFIRAIPDSLRLAERNSVNWSQAVAACGQAVTLAAEYDVSRQEAEDAGIDHVKPVHRASLADTEEEKALLRLSEKREALDGSLKRRADILADLGGFRACQVLRNCLDKCLAALDRAKAQYREATDQAETDPLSLGLRARRIRLLEAAVSRCHEDLAVFGSYPRLSSLPAHPEKQLFSSELLTAPAAEAISGFLLSKDQEQAAAARKKLFDLLPALFTGFSLQDPKDLFRDLAERCSFSGGTDPVVRLFISAWAVCSSGFSRRRFHLPDGVPDVALLPDADPREPVLSFSALKEILPASGSATDISDLRGLLAMLLLRPYRRLNSGEAALRVHSLRKTPGSVSPVLDTWLSCRNAGHVQLLCLESDALGVCPMALVLPGRMMIPARRSASFASFVPAFATWFSQSDNVFRDPVTALSSADRSILLCQLDRMISVPESSAAETDFLQFLSLFASDLRSSGSDEPEDTFLSMRLKAACALSDLPAFRSVITRIMPAYEHLLPSDPVCAALTDAPDFPPADSVSDPEAVYLWKGIPFARENAAVLLKSLYMPEDEYVLTTLNRDCVMLSDCSDDYREALCRNLQSLLSRYPDADERSRSLAWKLLTEAEKPIAEKATLLDWPWDPASPSVLTILQECLGAALAGPAASPFTSRLTVFPARNQDIIGDMVLRSQCVLPAFVRPDAGAESIPASDTVLPPLQPAFAAALCSTPEGRTLVQHEMLAFSRLENGSVQATLTLEGGFTLRMRRTYEPADLLSLFAQDIPTIAVWPAVPLPPDQWRFYSVYTHLSAGFSVSAESGSAEQPGVMSESGPRSVMILKEFPSCFSLWHGEQPVGSLLNLLPEISLSASEETTVCMDLGSSASSVMLTRGKNREPLHGPGAVRLLLSNPAVSADLLRQEYLPAVPVSALLPAAVRIFSNTPGTAPVPFRDGILLMAASLRDVFLLKEEAIYTSLKWNGEKGRSLRICLHQMMLLAAFQARTEGARSLNWRFALPDDAAPDGKENLISLIRSLAEQVSAESCLPFPDHQPPVSFAAESTALGAYFRLVAPEDTRGGFMTLDLGSATADLSLFLRGRDHAERTCQLPLGLQYMLLPSLMKNPELLLQDFSFIGEENLLLELRTLSGILREAVRDPGMLRHARLALDTLAADRLPVLVAAAARCRNEGRPTRTGALILFYLSYLMMLSGLLLLQLSVDSNRNDFLPEQMTLFLAGRGAALPDMFSLPVKTGLWRILTMFRNRKVASLSLLFSSEKKLEIAVGLSVTGDTVAGLPPAAPAPVSVSLRPEELLPEFLLRFLQEFPGEALLLFPDLYASHPLQPFTPAGQSEISASVSAAFAGQSQSLRPFDALASWPHMLLEIYGEHHPAEGGSASWNS